jgi:hypothetical protein
MSRSAGVIAGVAVALLLSACSGQEATTATPVSAEVAAPAEPERLPIGEITPEDVPALMSVAFPDGIPAGVEDIGTFVLGERVGLLTGSDNADACDTCTGSLSLFYLVRMDTGFMMQRAYPDFHKTGSQGKFSRDVKVVRYGGVEGGPAYAGFADINAQAEVGCAASNLTVGIFTEAGPKIALETPFGFRKSGSRVDANVIDSAPYQADFAIEYLSDRDQFVAPYLFVNHGLRPSFPSPAWAQAGCG